MELGPSNHGAAVSSTNAKRAIADHPAVGVVQPRLLDSERHSTLPTHTILALETKPHAGWAGKAARRTTWRAPSGPCLPDCPHQNSETGTEL